MGDAEDLKSLHDANMDYAMDAAQRRLRTMTPTIESLSNELSALERRVSALESPNINAKELNRPGASVASKPEPRRRDLLNVGAGPAAHEIQRRFPWMIRAAQLNPGKVHPLLGLNNQAVGVRRGDIRDGAARRAREKVKEIVQECDEHEGRPPRYVYLDEIPYGNSMMRNPLHRVMVEDFAGADDIVHTQIAVHAGMRLGLSDLGIDCDAILGMPEGMKSVDHAELAEFQRAADTFSDRYGGLIRDSGLKMGLCWSYPGLSAWQWSMDAFAHRSVACRQANEVAWGVPFHRCFANVVYGNRGGIARTGDVDPRSDRLTPTLPDDRLRWHPDHIHTYRDWSNDPDEIIGVWFNGNGDEEQYSLDTVPSIIEVMAEV